MSGAERATIQVRSDRGVAECPACGDSVELPTGAGRGSQLTCPECGEKLEVVVALKRLQLNASLDQDWRGESGPDSSSDRVSRRPRKRRWYGPVTGP
jgi:predicted RNA-binding Zn-ribbon protein involved in translation (DUF1610 family)